MAISTPQPKRYNPLVDYLDDLRDGGLTPKPNYFDTYTEYAIRGRMVVANYMIGNGLNMDNAAIKDRLAQELAFKLIESNVINFTVKNDLASDSRHFAGRVFLVPSEDVQLLRVLNNELPKR
jgi:hypothetical protein